MSRKDTKDDLLYYLNDPKVPVIALKGLWGTGKTFLWEEVKGGYTLASDRDALYASCFGLGSLDELKQALFQNSLGDAAGAISTARTTFSVTKGVVEKIVGKLVPGADGVTTLVGSIGGLLQSAVIDRTLRERLIVLDDIERRGAGLKIDALLGFIDLLKRNNCKVLLILNEEPLTSALQGDWSTLKEKCVDREVSLLTAPTEAAALGLDRNTPYRQHITESLEQLGVTNIRVVQRIDRVVGTIFRGHPSLHHAVAKDLVPAVVLLTALNFNAVPKGPDVAALLAAWRKWCVRPSPMDDRAGKISDEIAFALNFKLTSDIEFVDLVQKHLLTGQRLSDKFESLLKARESRAANNDVENAAARYLDATYLDPTMTDQDFIDTARAYATKWDSLSADRVSAIASDLARRGASELANDIADRWAARWRATPQMWLEFLHPTAAYFPAIRDALADGNLQFTNKPSLIEAVLKVSGKSWDRSHERAINDATVEEMTRTIEALGRDNFAQFAFFFRTELGEPITLNEQPLFAKGTDVFIEAASAIKREGRNPRLVELLTWHVGEHLHLSTITPATGATSPSAGES